ncbi:unnamed protein product, partial [Heterotrigona itama]
GVYHLDNHHVHHANHATIGHSGFLCERHQKRYFFGRDSVDHVDFDEFLPPPPNLDYHDYSRQFPRDLTTQTRLAKAHDRKCACIYQAENCRTTLDSFKLKKACTSVETNSLIGQGQEPVALFERDRVDLAIPRRHEQSAESPATPRGQLPLTETTN